MLKNLINYELSNANTVLMLKKIAKVELKKKMQQVTNFTNFSSESYFQIL